LYNVHMARTTASQARQHLSRLLDAAERGEEVIVERRGVQFRIVAEAMETGAVSSSEPLLLADDAVLAGEWHWSTGDDGDLVFVDDRGQEG
jgi:prevent-host-death family protein